MRNAHDRSMKIGYTGDLLVKVTKMFPDRDMDSLTKVSFDNGQPPSLKPRWSTLVDDATFDILFINPYIIPDVILTSLLFETKTITDSVVLIHDQIDDDETMSSSSWDLVIDMSPYIQLLKDQGFHSVLQVRDYIVGYTTSFT